ncbi:hypothetical protein GCM10008018_64890 [Paenibacillus marchantiophytorum]|uniref:DUF3951 domain-containing protein n=1 Tax=Paenibacillus marchantiophytorum TaxID=1619310 RepID=A0ABQ1FFV9_9BACL|nr:hypothetical protein [Paenibacillus marchantiophytorum]GGA10586.1 hypothetical protein GCM10008018_64890 [Paenibacillus marchantiophytorum]
MKIREVVSIVIGLGFIFVGFLIFSMFYGNPFSKYKFNNEIQAKRSLIGKGL